MRRRNASLADQPGLIFGHVPLTQTCQERPLVSVKEITRPSHTSGDAIASEILDELQNPQSVPVKTFPPPDGKILSEHSNIICSQQQLLSNLHLAECQYVFSKKIQICSVNSKKYQKFKRRADNLMEIEYEIDKHTSDRSEGKTRDAKSNLDESTYSASGNCHDLSASSGSRQISTTSNKGNMCKSTDEIKTETTRIPILQSFNPTYEYDGGLEQKLRSFEKNMEFLTNPDWLSLGKLPSTRFILEFSSFDFKFANGALEPFFLELFIFDHANSLKLSESFWILHDKSNIISSLEGLPDGDYAGNYTCKSAIFSISDPHSEVFLACKVYRILQGELKPAYDCYSLASDARLKGNYSRSEMTTTCQRFLNFRQTFAWSYLTLFDEKRKFIGDVSKFAEFGAIPSPNETFDIYMLKAAILLRQRNPKALMNLPASLDVKITHCHGSRSSILGDISKSGSFVILDPHFRRIDQPRNPKPSDSHSLKSTPTETVPKVTNPKHVRLICEIFEFTPIRNIWPNQEYQNLLYVYPEHLSIGEHRNLCVMIQLRDNDDSAVQSGLPMVYGNPPLQILRNRAYSEITYHSRYPTFDSEFKIRLPAVLNSRHHLCFTFYYVNVAKKKSDKEISTIVGYSILPLYNDGRVTDRDHTLAIFTKLARPPYLLSLSNPDKSTMMDPVRNYFRVRLELQSTLYSSNPYLTKFFKDGRVSKSVGNFLYSQGGSMSRALDDLDSKKTSVSFQPEEESKDIVSQIMTNAYRTGMLTRRTDSLGQGWKLGYAVLSTSKFRVLQSPFSNSGSKQYNIDTPDFSAELFMDKEKGLVLVISSETLRVKQKAAESKDEIEYSISSTRSSEMSLADKRRRPSNTLDSQKQLSSAAFYDSRLTVLRLIDKDPVGDKRAIFSCQFPNEIISWYNCFTHIKIRSLGTLNALTSLSYADPISISNFLPQISVRLLKIMMFGDFEFDSGTVLIFRTQYNDRLAKEFVDKCRITSFQTFLSTINVVHELWEKWTSNPKAALGNLQKTDRSSQKIESKEDEVNPISETLTESRTGKNCPILMHLSHHLMDLTNMNGGYMLSLTKPHESLVALWSACIQNKNHPDFIWSYGISIKYAWFLLEVISRCMLLSYNSKCNHSLSPDEQETFFKDQYVVALNDLVCMLTDEVKRKIRADYFAADLLSNTLALFVKKCFLVMPRIIVFSLIEKYVRRIEPLDDVETVKCFINFMKILFEDEQFVPLSCAAKLTKSLSVFISERFPTDAYFLFEYSMCVDKYFRNDQSFDISGGDEYFSEVSAIGRLNRPLTINFVPMVMMSKLLTHLREEKFSKFSELWVDFLRDYFTKLDYDKRYPRNLKSYICSMFLPLVTEISRANLLLSKLNHHVQKDLMACFLFILKNTRSSKLRSFMINYWKAETLLKIRTRKPADRQFSENHFDAESDKVLNHEKSQSVSSDSKRLLYLTAGGKMSPVIRYLLKFLESLNICVKLFEYFQPQRSRNSITFIEDELKGSKPSSNKPSTAYETTEGPASVLHDQVALKGDSRKSAEATFAHEASHLILDIYLSVELSLFHEFVENPWRKYKTKVQLNSEHVFQLRDQLIMFLIQQLSLEQSYRFYHRLLLSCGELCSFHARTIFDYRIKSREPKMCFKLWYTLFKRSCLYNETTSHAAVNTIYQILHDAFISIGSLSRLRIPFMTAFLEFVGSLVKTSDVQRFNALSSSIQWLKKLATDNIESSFGALRALKVHVISICELLNQIIALKAVRNRKLEKESEISVFSDNDAIFDAYMQIIFNPQNNIEVQIYFLKELRDFHISLKNYVEAGRCQFEVAKLMMKLYRRDPSSKLRTQLEETLLSAASAFDKGELPEFSVKALGIQESIIRSESSSLNYSPDQFQKLADLQRRLVSYRSKILKFEQETSIRLFWSTYRVVFYGKVFGTLHKKEFIYKQPPLTPLAQMKSFLLSTFSNEDTVSLQVIFDSNVVDEEKLDYERNYFIQVNSVEPIHDTRNPTSAEKYVDLSNI